MGGTFQSCDDCDPPGSRGWPSLAKSGNLPGITRQIAQLTCLGYSYTHIEGKYFIPALFMSPRLLSFGVAFVLGVLVPSAGLHAETGTASVPNPSFEDGTATPAGWTVTGEVRVEADASVAGKHALVLRRDPVQLPATQASSGRFPLRAGVWELSGAYTGKLHSPDVSFNVAVGVPAYGADGNLLKNRRLVVVSGERAWTRFKERFDVPSGAEAGAIEITFNKTHGEFRIDDLALTYIGASIPMEGGDRKVVFKTNRVGHLFYPGDEVRVEVTVETPAALSGDRLNLGWQVTDFYGAPAAARQTTALVKAGDGVNARGWNVYRGVLDMAGLPLKIGPYYEIQTTLDLGAGAAARDTGSFAILPEAASKQLDPLASPFGAHTWNATVYEYFPLAARLGIRRGLVFWRWPETAPYTPQFDEGHAHDSRIGWPKRFGIAPFGVLYPVMWTEHRDGPLYTEEALREGVRQSIENYKKDGLWGFQIGNEPPSWNAEWVKRDVETYKIVYEEIKKTDPNFVAIGSAIGPNEAFFKAGFQAYQDVYNIHAYSDLGELRLDMRRYKEMFKKYGGEKPIWSTEIGSKSQGLPRDVIARDIVRKAVVFFAEGGGFFSWFAVGGMPDPEGERSGSYSDSMDLFGAKYNMHLPRLDAVAYYHLINTLGAKRFLAETAYAGGLHGFLFRDEQFNSLQVFWADGDARDVFLPLPGIHEVTLTWMNGAQRHLDAGGRGIQLRLGADPVFVAFRGDRTTLPAQLDAPTQVVLATLPEALTQGRAAGVTVRAAAGRAVRLRGPATWTITATGETAAADGAREFTYRIDVPGDTSARLATFVVTDETVTKAGDTELRFQIPVRSKIGLRVLPVAGEREGDSAVRLVLKNESDQPQPVTWKVELLNELPMAGGTYALNDAKPSSAYFSTVAEDKTTLAPGAEKTVVLPISGADRQALYQIRATATDATGNTVQAMRRVGGFARVVRATGGIQLDGRLDEAAWKNAPGFRLDEARQFCRVEKQGKPWAGVDDLSGVLRFAWDEQALYVAVEVKDDLFKNPKSDKQLWNQDGLQFVIDPYRAETASRGRYDYSMGLGQKGPQAWCHMSGDPSAPAGLASEIKLAVRPVSETNGDRIYEVAIPWTRLAPFKPGVQANLGLTMVINEDDGTGRKSTIGWFGGVHLKEANFVGDLILSE